MADAGFFKGTSAEQDSRFANKQKKLLKQMKFPDNIDIKIDMSKVNLDILKPWITKRLQELLGIEDDVVIEFVFNQLDEKNPDPKMMQINLTGFLGGSKARLFIGELWKLLANAQASPDGIPEELVEMKKKELLKRQEEDDRLREIRKREEESHRQAIKPDMDKLETNGRNLMSSSSNKSRHENGNVAGYKSRPYYDDDRRNRDRRRSPENTRRPRDLQNPEPKLRRTDKKPARSVSKSSEDENDRHHRQEKTKTHPKPVSDRQDRHRLPSKSPSHSRSPIKSSRKSEKKQQRSSSSSSAASNSAHQEIEKIKSKPKARSPSSSSSVDRSNKKTVQSIKEPPASKTKSPSCSKPINEPVSSKSTSNQEKIKSKVSPIKEIKKNTKQSKRTRSLSASRSNSNSSIASSRSSVSSEAESKKNKKQKKKPQPTKSGSSSRSRSPSPNRNRKSDKKKDDHKSRKHGKSSSRKHHHSSDNKRKSHRDHPDKFKTKKTHRNESSKKKTSNLSDNEILTSSSPKKPRLESQIRVQTPPPSSKLSDNNKTQQSSAPIKPNRTERIVVLEDSRTDRIGSVLSRVSITSKPLYNEEHEKKNNNTSSEDENEVDLRERLLREKAIKSMKRRQFSTDNNDRNTKTTIERIVYETQ